MTITILNEFKNLLPALSNEEYSTLENSIINEGCRDPLVLWENNGKNILIDGHNRYEICTKNNIAFKTCFEVFADKDEACDWIDRNQLGRRNLTPDAFRLALGRIYNRTKKAAHGREGRKFWEGQNAPPKNSHETARKIGEKYGVNESTVRRAGKFASEAEKDPVLMNAILSGANKENQSISVRDYKKEKLLKKRQEKYKTIIDNNKALPIDKRKYSCIYADPPWQTECNMEDSRGAPNHYPTMTLEDICALPVDKLAADDCVLFLWTTAPKALEAGKVIKHWGFTYKTQAIWDKEIIGMGTYFRTQHELLYVAIKGDMPAAMSDGRVSSIFKFRREKHSQKPDEFYGVIEKMYPDMERIELFARNKRDGWDSWGFEA